MHIFFLIPVNKRRLTTYVQEASTAAADDLIQHTEIVASQNFPIISHRANVGIVFC